MLGWNHIQRREYRDYSAPAAAARPAARQRGSLAIAIHELHHAAYASYHTMVVRRCAVVPLACTDIVSPFEPSGLAAAFRACPELALLDLMAIVGVLGAQAFGERTLLRQPHEREDARLIAAYRDAYLRLPRTYLSSRSPVLDTGENTLCVTPAWPALVEQARSVVWRWRQRPGAVEAVMALAGHLVQVGAVDQQEWEQLWRSPVARPLRFQPRVERQGPHRSDKLKFWILGESKNGVCEECQAVADANADGVNEDEDFHSHIPGDSIQGPPLHKHCVCTVAYGSISRP